MAAVMRVRRRRNRNDFNILQISRRLAPAAAELPVGALPPLGFSLTWLARLNTVILLNAGTRLYV